MKLHAHWRPRTARQFLSNIAETIHFVTVEPLDLNRLMLDTSDINVHPTTATWVLMRKGHA